MRRDGEDWFNLYEIGADGTGLVQLTDGPFNDIDPCYLPDGGIIFSSTRCNRYVPCWRVPVFVLHCRVQISKSASGWCWFVKQRF